MNTESSTSHRIGGAEPPSWRRIAEVGVHSGGPGLSITSCIVRSADHRPHGQRQT